MMEISDSGGEVRMYDDPKKIVPPQNLDELIKELHKVFASDHVNVEYVTQLMASYKSNPKDWKKFAIFDLHRYTRNLVDTGNGKFNLMVLCWNTSQGSSIHDHANAHCFMKVLDGHAQEELFEWPSESEDMVSMTPKGKNLYKRNEVAYISDEIGLHRVENPSHSDTAVTLHLYSPPFSECQSFDERTGNANKVQVTFWSQYGKRTPCAKLPSSCVPENN
ncbi:cysteine dioxygenase type 1-like [Saccostrea echinata]|uniref:cysteine dioxygenase type 1-like n=1 Tax=Saccostrea echinata TaxID=191078 RepID=UPI002A81D0CC|nr:cysteine dioxygenase type 1-like [Saccostrea echinata]